MSLQRRVTPPPIAHSGAGITAPSWDHRLLAYRGSFGPVKDLNTKIRAFIDGWNDRCHPFVWTKTAGQILKKANRQITSNTDH